MALEGPVVRRGQLLRGRRQSPVEIAPVGERLIAIHRSLPHPMAEVFAAGKDLRVAPGSLDLLRRAHRRPFVLRHHAQKTFDPDYANTGQDRKSTRLNSSHSSISYAVFCLKKKKQQ